MVVAIFLALLAAAEGCQWGKTNFTVDHMFYFCCAPYATTSLKTASVTFKSEVADSYSFYFSQFVYDAKCGDAKPPPGSGQKFSVRTAPSASKRLCSPQITIINQHQCLHCAQDNLNHTLKFNSTDPGWAFLAGFECHNKVEQCTMQIESLTMGDAQEGVPTTWSS